VVIEKAQRNFAFKFVTQIKTKLQGKLLFFFTKSYVGKLLINFVTSSVFLCINVVSVDVIVGAYLQDSPI
jgi:hypothetical protein